MAKESLTREDILGPFLSPNWDKLEPDEKAILIKGHDLDLQLAELIGMTRLIIRTKSDDEITEDSLLSPDSENGERIARAVRLERFAQAKLQPQRSWTGKTDQKETKERHR